LQPFYPVNWIEMLPEKLSQTAINRVDVCSRFGMASQFARHYRYAEVPVIV
jgi:hypothetical protein